MLLPTAAFMEFIPIQHSGNYMLQRSFYRKLEFDCAFLLGMSLFEEEDGYPLKLFIGSVIKKCQINDHL